MKFQLHPTNGQRDTDEMVVCFPSKVAFLTTCFKLVLFVAYARIVGAMKSNLHVSNGRRGTDEKYFAVQIKYPSLLTDFNQACHVCSECVASGR